MTASDNGSVRLSRDGAILEIVLDRPKANAIDKATSLRLNAVFEELRDDPALRVAILTGAGRGSSPRGGTSRPRPRAKPPMPTGARAASRA